MATAGRAEDLDVSRAYLGDVLREHPYTFDFFQAVRLLERLLPGRSPVGRFAVPDREVVRFGVNNTLSFPASQIQSLEWPAGGQPRMLVNFMGLTGPLGVLPYAFTQMIQERGRAKDWALQEFFDLFNHRLISLFYQAWEKYRFFVAYERDQQDRFSRLVMSLIGLGTGGLDNRQPVRDESFLFYSGLLSLQARSAAALEAILADYFDVPVEVEQFVGAWYPLDSGNQCCFESEDPCSGQLGVGAVVGDQVWDQQSRARIRLGPLSLRQYLDFLPSGTAFEPLRALTRMFSHEIEFEIQLLLRRGEVPRCELGSEEEAAPLLGWTSWIKSGPTFGRDPEDTVLLLDSAGPRPPGGG